MIVFHVTSYDVYAELAFLNLQEKAIIIRVTRIVYAFRNRRWPKPMEGLELFTPTVSQDGSSSESSESEGEGAGDGNYHRGRVVGAGESTWRRASHRGQRSHVAKDEEEEEPLNVDDVDDDRDFEIEKVGWCLLETRMHCFVIIIIYCMNFCQDNC